MASGLLSPIVALALPVLFAAGTPCAGSHCASAPRQEIARTPAECTGPNCRAATPAYEGGIAPTNTAGASAWSSWLTVYGDYGIAFRWKVNTYGGGIAPDCEVEFKNSTRKADFRFKINYNGGEESGIAYGITEADTFVEMVDPCRSVSSVTVTEVRRR